MPDWLGILSPLTAIVAALVAGAFAYRANRATIANQRVMELEKRLSTSRLETYRPMLEAMAAYMLPGQVAEQERKRRQQTYLAAAKSFITWIQVYGSDEAVRTFHRMMQAAYASAPPPVMLRMYGDFLFGRAPRHRRQ